MRIHTVASRHNHHSWYNVIHKMFLPGTLWPSGTIIPAQLIQYQVWYKMFVPGTLWPAGTSQPANLSWGRPQQFMDLTPRQPLSACLAMLRWVSTVIPYMISVPVLPGCFWWCCWLLWGGGAGIYLNLFAFYEQGVWSVMCHFFRVSIVSLQNVSKAPCGVSLVAGGDSGS